MFLEIERDQENSWGESVSPLWGRLLFFFLSPPPSTLFDFVDLLEKDKEHEVGQVGK